MFVYVYVYVYVYVCAEGENISHLLLDAKFIIYVLNWNNKQLFGFIYFKKVYTN